MVGCSIRNCSSRSVKGGTIRFFSFPSKESVANEWLRYCGSKTTTKNGRVCSKHFLSSDYCKPLRHIILNESPKNARTLKPDAIPSLEINNVREQNTLDNKEEQNTFDIKEEQNTRDIKEEQNTLDIKDEQNTRDIKEEQNTLDIKVEQNSHDIKVEQNTFDIKVEVTIETEDTSDNMSCLSKCNTISTNDVAGSSKVIEKSDVTINISLSEYDSLKRTAKEYNILKNNLEKIFTPGQIRCLMQPNRRRIKWSSEDIAAALFLRSISRKAYRHLKVTVGIPLPAFSTLRKWVPKCEIKKEILENEIQRQGV